MIIQSYSLSYRLEITVYYILLVEQAQAFHNRITEAPYQAHAETVVIVLLYQLVQIETAKIEKNRGKKTLRLVLQKKRDSEQPHRNCLQNK